MSNGNGNGNNNGNRGNQGGGREIRIDEGSIRKGGINQTPTTPRPNVNPPPAKPPKGR